MAIPHVLAHEHKDNVAVVVVEGVTKGMKLHGVVTADDSTFEVEAKADVPIGHKVALKNLKKGDTAVKYGEDIGRFVADVGPGDHVHVHNLKTKRW
jgi:(2R)-sulfolactate sulfo-lyase subunit alpha